MKYLKHRNPVSRTPCPFKIIALAISLKGYNIMICHAKILFYHIVWMAFRHHKQVVCAVRLDVSLSYIYCGDDFVNNYFSFSLLISKFTLVGCNTNMVIVCVVQILQILVPTSRAISYGILYFRLHFYNELAATI